MLLNSCKFVFFLLLLMLITSVNGFSPHKKFYSYVKKFNRRIYSSTSKLLNKVPVPISPEKYMTSIEIIKNRGYPAEIHNVVTDDGYILELHRIPYGKNEVYDPSKKKRPVFLQHGFLNSDADWLITDSSVSLAFNLADGGYDVWLGNIRGNTYSRKHVSLSPAGEKYWDFSWDDMGEFDIPAVINFILSVTGRQKLIYVGHSMGCSIFFVAMIKHPELNKKIELMIALAPATSLAHSRSLLTYLAPFTRQIETFNRLVGTRAFLPNDGTTQKVQSLACEQSYKELIFCRNLNFLLQGDDPANYNLTLLPVIDGHNPAGTSVRTFVQFGQNYNSGETFIPYNFGLWGNLRRYGRLTPPPYDLSQVTAPVYLFWGPNDFLVAPQDVSWLAGKLGNLKGSIRVDDDKFNHADFLWAIRVKELVYSKVFALLPSPLP